MAEPKAGLSPVAIRKHGNTRGREGSVSSKHSIVNFRDHHSKAGQKHQPINRELSNATLSSTSSTIGVVDGAASSNGLCVVSKDAVKKLKGKEAASLNRNLVDLTGDSPQNDGTRLTCSRDNASSGLSFLRRHHRIGRPHRSPLPSNEGSSQQFPFEADIAVLGSRQTVHADRGGSSWGVPLSPGGTSVEKISGQRTLDMQSNRHDEARDASVNATSSSGVSSGERRDTDTLIDPQASGLLSEPERPLSWKRKRSHVQDAAKSRQRFNPPRMVNGGTRSPFGGMQKPIDVDNLEEPSGAIVDNDLRALERARQIEEDEKLAMFLQQEYGAEVDGGSFNMDDAQLAQMLQDEENALRLQQRVESTSQATNASTLRAARMEVQRLLPSVRAPVARPSASSSRMRILRNLHNRSSQHVTRGRRLGGRMISANEDLLHFPEGLGLEARVEFLAALETASQVDRDFNEADYEMLLALDDANHAQSGASFDKIEQLPVSVIKPTDIVEEACSICLETPVVDDLVRRLPCMHVFHVQCIDEWLERQANCPICKMAL